MKRWKVVFEIYRNNGRELATVNVEAGTKKLAVTRAMLEINKDGKYSDDFKKVHSIEEVG